MKETTLTVRLTLGLILLNAAVWLVFAVLVLDWAVPGLPDLPALRGLMAGLALVCSLALTAFFLRRRARLALVAAMLLLTTIAVLSITDQVGWLDLLSLLISLVPLVLLGKDRHWYLDQR